MGLRRHYRPIVVALAILAGAFTATQTGGRMAGDGLLYDLSLAVRASHQDEEPVVVVALDRRSLQAEELRDLPRALFARHWAQLVQALAEAEATAIGFDILFAWSAAALLPEDERAFLATLAANRDRVVLGRSAAWTPARPFFFAIGAGSDSNALGFLELAPDRDGIFRRVPTSLATDDGAFAGLAAAMAVKAGLPAMTAPQLLAPRRALSAIPTVSLIDVLRCAEQDPAGLKAVFRGRLVVVGSVLPDEDRKRTLDRFFPEPPGQGTSGPACGLGSGIVARQGGTLPGVLLHAEALGEHALGRHVAQMHASLTTALNAAMAGLGAVAGLFLAPVVALLAAVIAVGLMFAAFTALLGAEIWLPGALPIATGIVALVLAYVARYVIAERRRRQIQDAFGHYLAPAIVAELATSESPPKLGGELGEVSVMFADLSGFTAMSGKVGPEELMATTNDYLGVIAEAVEETGGYVDKFIGDAVMAVWGAPVADPSHAVRAVRAAEAAIARVDAMHAEAEARGEFGYSVKVGVHSGPATMGNVGWARRFNYTAIGETVNIAARLESVPGDYACRLVVGETTAAAAGEAFLFCELDWLRVKGKREPIAIHEPLAETEQAYAAAYAKALAAYRAADFAAAHAQWSTLVYPGEGNGPPAIMAARAQHLIDEPPEAPWDAIWTKRTK